MTKQKISDYIDKNEDRLRQVSSEIFHNPELGFEEYKASKLLASELEKDNFDTKLGVANLETAIQAIHHNTSDIKAG